MCKINQPISRDHIMVLAARLQAQNMIYGLNESLKMQTTIVENSVVIFFPSKLKHGSCSLDATQHQPNRNIKHLKVIQTGQFHQSLETYGIGHYFKFHGRDLLQQNTLVVINC